MFKARVLTISDSASSGKRKDASGAAVQELLALTGRFQVECGAVVPDETDAISAILERWADSGACDLIVTTGGTGLSPRDVTPEATLNIIEREIPGMAEAMRMEGLKNTPRAMLSRAVCGVRNRTLIVNLPGSPGGVRDGLSTIIEILPHAIEKIQGDPTPCSG